MEFAQQFPLSLGEASDAPVYDVFLTSEIRKTEIRTTLLLRTTFLLRTTDSDLSLHCC